MGSQSRPASINDGQVVVTDEDGASACETACQEHGGGESVNQRNPNAGDESDESHVDRSTTIAPDQAPGPDRKP